MRLDALVINLNRFGDLLLSQPLLHDLHKAGRSTTLLCLEKYADTEGLLQFASPLLTVPDHLVSPEQADATRHELQAWAENLRATVQADKAAVESAALDLSYCTLRAPISGRVGGLKVDKGNMVRSSDTTPIVSIDTLSPIYVTFSVPERHLSLILDRMHAGPVEVDVTPTGGQTEKGLLTLVENSVDTTTGTIQLRATFDNENRRLWPGQFVTVELPLGMARQALAIPSRAVQSGREENYLYVAGADGKASYRKVNILFEAGDISVVEGELKAGEQVIIDGIVRLAPDVPVKVIQ